MTSVTTPLRILNLVLTPLSGPYRVLSEPYDKFGGFVYGTLTFFGLTVIYPRVNAELHGFGIWPPFIWFGQLVLAYVYAFARWFSLKPPPDPGKRNSWAGRNEPLFAIAIVFACFGLRSPGTGLLLLSGFIASQIQVELVNLIRRLEGWTPEDGEKVKEAAAARAKRLRGLATAALMSIRRKPEIVDVMRAPQPVAATGLLDQLYPPHGGYHPPHHQQVAQAPAASKPTTLKDRVVSGLISHFIFWCVFGSLGISGIFAILLFLLSLPILIVGGSVHMPESLRLKVPAPIVRMVEGFQEKKEAVKEAVGDKVDAVKDRLHMRRPEKAAIEDEPPAIPASQVAPTAPPAPSHQQFPTHMPPPERVTTIDASGRKTEQAIQQTSVVIAPDDAAAENARPARRNVEEGRRLMREAEERAKRAAEKQFLEYLIKKAAEEATRR